MTLPRLGGAQALELALQSGLASAKSLLSKLDVGVASLASTTTTALAGGERRIVADTRGFVGDAGELDLGTRDVGLGAPLEDLEDHPRAVEDRHAKRSFEVALLRRRERPVEDEQRLGLFSIDGSEPLAKFVELARAEHRGGQGARSALDERVGGRNPQPDEEQLELSDRGMNIVFGLLERGTRDEHGVAGRRGGGAWSRGRHAIFLGIGRVGRATAEIGRTCSGTQKHEIGSTRPTDHVRSASARIREN
jgi:hypothetical protein